MASALRRGDGNEPSSPKPDSPHRHLCCHSTRARHLPGTHRPCRWPGAGQSTGTARRLTGAPRVESRASRRPDRGHRVRKGRGRGAQGRCARRAAARHRRRRHRRRGRLYHDERACCRRRTAGSRDSFSLRKVSERRGDGDRRGEAGRSRVAQDRWPPAADAIVQREASATRTDSRRDRQPKRAAEFCDDGRDQFRMAPARSGQSNGVLANRRAHQPRQQWRTVGGRLRRGRRPEHVHHQQQRRQRRVRLRHSSARRGLRVPQPAGVRPCRAR